MRNRVPAGVAALLVSLAVGFAGSVPAVAATSHSGHHRGVRPGTHVAITRPGGSGHRGVRTVSTSSGPAVSPPQAAILPGIEVPLAGTPEGVAVDSSGIVAVSVRNPAAVVLFPINEPLIRHTVPLTGSGRHLSLAGPSGPLLVPEATGNAVAELSLPSGTSEATIPVGRGPQQAVALGTDTVVVADQQAGTLRIVRGGQVTGTIRSPGRPGDLAASPDGTHFVVVGSRSRTLTEYAADGSKVGSVRAGVNPTHVVAGNDGLFWVVDTGSGSVLGFQLGAKGPVRVATIPVGSVQSRPYGLAFDPARDTLWVTLTGTNRLVSLKLSGLAVQSRTSQITVRQPNSVAVVPGSGSVVVTGSTPQGQLQFFGVSAS